ncbi:hypothetical protein [Chryseobacterium daeguense]|uniref:hypothetical protein n=1 Tax=Chryseobacterium daeguense TaxID=412438 RepID=UPI000413D5C6|nr:hypothetical protein [Chryseobacterium daeguense]
MVNYVESFHLNSEDVRNVSLSYEGYAKYLIKKENLKDFFLIGNCYLIAGIFCCLLNPSKAKKLFGYAANNFVLADSPLAFLCKICAQDTFEKGLDDENFLYAYLRTNNTISDNISGDFIEGFIPKLNIPFKLLKDALDELKEFKLENQKFHLIILII